MRLGIHDNGRETIMRRGFVTLCLLWLLSGPLVAHAVPALVQSNAVDDDADDTSIQATFPSNTTTGNFIYVWAYHNSGITINSISDGTNTYTPIETALWVCTGFSGRLSHWYAKNITGGTTPTITVTTAAASNFKRLHIMEFSGVDQTAPLDQHPNSGPDSGSCQYAPGTATDAVTSQTATTTTNGQLILGGNVSGILANTTVGTGYTQVRYTGGTTTEYKVQASAGNVAATYTYAADTNAGTTIATFKAAAGSGATPRNLMLLGVGP